MAVRKYSSRSQKTTLASAITSSSASITVVSAAALMGGKTLTPNQRFTIVIDPDTALEEIVQVFSSTTNPVSSNTIAIARGIDGSIPQAHSAGAEVRHMAIGEDYQEANDHINNSTDPHGLVIANVVETTDTGTVSTTMLAANAVTTAKITDANVTTAKIADGAVTSAKIADLSITTAKIADGAITSAKLADGGIGTADIADLAVTTAKVADSAITSAKIADGTIVAGDIADGAITSAKILDGTIVNGDIAPSAAIAYSKLNLANSISSADILAGTIVDSDISGAASIALSKLATDPLARANHTGTQTASTVSDFDTQVRTSRLDQMAAPTTSVSANNQKITNLGTPTASTDASTKAYVDTSIANLVDGAPGTLDTLNEIAAAINDTANFSDTVVLKTGSTMSGPLAMGTNKITGLGDPTAAQDAATKAYADAILVGAPGNLTGPITSVGAATAIASQTGTGTKFVVDTSPTLITPNIGAATATTINTVSVGRGGNNSGTNLAVGNTNTLQSNTTGANNTAIGNQGLFSNTTGASNVAFGTGALTSNTTGNYNTAVGNDALSANVTNSQNVAIGDGALETATASNNVAVGVNALARNLTGGSNTAVGTGAGQYITSGNSNAAFGTSSGPRGAATNTVALGNSAIGASSTLATFGTIIGGTGYTDGTYKKVSLALSSGPSAYTAPTVDIVVSGGAVTSVSLTSPWSSGRGIAVGQSFTTAAANIGGTGSGFVVPVGTTTTGGQDSVAIGATTLNANTNGVSNIAVGTNSLGSLHTGDYNVGIGFQSQFGLYRGTNNISLGRNTGPQGQVDSLVSIGGLAGRYLSSVLGTLGTIVGGSGYTNGTYNNVTLTNYVGPTPITQPTANITVSGGAVTAVTLTGTGMGISTDMVFSASSASIGGTGSGFYVPVSTISSSARNVAIGLGALSTSTISSDNTGIGHNALIANTFGYSNTALGSLAGNTITTGFNNTVIGYNADTSSATASNEVSIGDTAVARFRVPGVGLDINKDIELMNIMGAY